MRGLLTIGLLVAVVWGAATVSARTNWQDCAGKRSAKGDRRIEACSAIIESGVQSRDELAVAYNNRGNAYQARGEFDRAIADYDAAIEADPKYAISYMNRGTAFDAKEEHERAIEDYTRAIELDRDFIEAYTNRGNTYLAMDDADRAIADFDRAIRIWNGYARAWFGRGRAHLMKREYRRAISDFDRAAQLNHERALEYACWARAVANVELERALDQCNQSLSQKQTADRFDDRGFALFRLGRCREAIADYDASLRLDPKSSSSLYMRGICKLRLGDPSGRDDIAAALALDPTKAEDYAARGVAP